jgi:hypothetical protein
MRSRPALWCMLLVPVTAIVTAAAMMVMFMAFLASALTAVAAVTAYVKREDWTLPAFRWTRDRTGRWRVTPWSGDGQAEVAKAESAE